MYRPSGTTVVTAALGALVIVHGVWSWGTRLAESRPQQSAPTPSATPDIGIGTTFLLHSGAWRAWPAPAEGTPAPVALPAPEEPAALPTEAPSPPIRSVPIQQITRHVEPQTPPPQTRATAQAEPSAPLVDEGAPAVPTPPTAEGRMALAGPDAEAAHPPASHASRSAPTSRPGPTAPERAPEAGTAAPSESKFGPAIFKEFERNGF
jgi:hypothetical protein